ncbi:MAG TPA: SIMPL domain-containing protein [Nocardioides sp.]|nr:SIMPL domain-containing protein [Nocardioides sp.]
MKFRDFAALAQWVGRHVAGTEGFSLDGVRWTLTEQRRLDLERDVRTRAVQDAARRAQEYADALGLGQVRPVAVADAGMLAQGLEIDGIGGVGYARMDVAGKEPGAELELSPEDIEVAASVDARFVAE